MPDMRLHLVYAFSPKAINRLPNGLIPVSFPSEFKNFNLGDTHIIPVADRTLSTNQPALVLGKTSKITSLPVSS
jgi:hypothetical protein